MAETPTPATTRSFDELVEIYRRMVAHYTSKGPYKPNPEPEVVEGLVRALARARQKWGWSYCP